MGLISVKGLRINACHGVLDQERRVGNEFMVDVVLDVPMADRAMDTDDLDDTVNYAEVVAIVKDEMSHPSKLIENVAGRIRNSLKRRYGDAIAGGEITIAKLAPPIAAQLDCVAYTTKW